MVVKFVLEWFYTIFDSLTKWISIPSFPDNVVDLLDEAVSYVVMGLGVLDNYIDVSFCLTLFTIYIGVEVGLNVYYFVMWIIKKVPFLGIK